MEAGNASFVPLELRWLLSQVCLASRLLKCLKGLVGAEIGFSREKPVVILMPCNQGFRAEA